MNIAPLKHADIHWREDGNSTGPTVVFANSLGTDLRLWDKILPHLPAHLRIIRFDNRGHGLSSVPEGAYQLQDLVDDTEQLLDYLKIDKCLFVGLSIGGMIGQSLAARRPELIEAMVLSNTASKMGDAAVWQQRIDSIEKEGMLSMADAIMQRWFGPDFLNLPEATAWKRMLLQTPAAGYIGCCHAIANADLTSTTSSLRLKVSGIAGSEDAASSAELVKQTIDLIPGAPCHVIQGAGHLPCVDYPIDYAAIVNVFFKTAAYDR